MGQFIIDYSDSAKTKMEELYGLTGQDLADNITNDIEGMIRKKYKRYKKREKSYTFSFNE